MSGFILGSACTIGMYVGWQWYQNQQIRKACSKDSDRQPGDDEVSGVRSSYDLVSDVSQSGFLTELVRQLWFYINKAGCTIVKESVEPIFATDLPKPLNTLHFSKLDLGRVPIRLDNIVVHEVDTVNQTIQFDIDVVWDGQCDIELKADYIGSLGVRHVKLAGRMCVILKPVVAVLPIVQAVQFGFINPPVLKLDFTGLAQLADLTIIDKSVRKVIQDVLKGVLVLPNRMTTRLDEVTKFYDIYKPPIGVARITILRGIGFTVQKSTFGTDDIVDVYCSCSMGSTEWKTSVCKDSLQPIWNESYDIILYDRDQILYIHAFDSDSGKLSTDDDLGTAQVTVGELLLATGHIQRLQLLDKDDRGTDSYVLVCADLLPFTTENMKSIEDQKKAIETKIGLRPVDRLIYGAVTIIISRVESIPIDNVKDANCFVKVEYGDGKVEGTTFQSSPVPGLNPFYDCAFVVPLTDMLGPADITFYLYNNDVKKDKDKKKTDPTLLGKYTVYHVDVINDPDHTISEKRAFGTQGATIDYEVKLSALQLPEISSKDQALKLDPETLIEQATTSTSPMAAGFSGLNSMVSVMLTIKSGRGFLKTKSRLRIGKSDVPDCYAKVRFGPLPEIWRTATVKDRVDPIWNESKQYDNVHLGMIVSFDVYDEDNGTLDKDDYVGNARVSVGKLLLAGVPVEVELHDKNGTGCGAYITVACEKIVVTEDNEGSTSFAVGSKDSGTIRSQPNSNSSKAIPFHPPFQILSRHADQTVEELISFRLVIADGYGFQVEKRKLRKDDVPDCYAKISIIDDPAKQIWKTSIIDNSIQPVWNESQDYYFVRHNMVLQVDIMDHDSGKNDADDIIGTAQIQLSKLLDSPGQRVELALNDGQMMGTPTGAVITLIGHLITPLTAESSPSLATACAEMTESVGLGSEATSTNVNETAKIGSNNSSKKVVPSSSGTIDVLSPTNVISMSGKNLLDVRLKVASGRGFQVERKAVKKNDIPDIYCIVRFGPNGKGWRTAAIKDNLEPSWNECQIFRFVQYDIAVYVDVYDEDKGTRDKDDYLGNAQIQLGTLLDRLGAAVEVPLLDASGVSTGAFITLVVENVTPSSGTECNTSTGLNSSSEVVPKPLVSVVTPVAYDASMTPATVSTITGSETSKNVLAISTLESVPTTDVKTTVPENKTLETIVPKPTQLREPEAAAKVLADTDNVSMQLTVVRGRDFPIERKKLRKDDIPDCYCKITIAPSTEVWRTATIKDNCNPVWDSQTKLYTDILVGSSIKVEVWDEDKGPRDPDDFLGSAIIPVRKFIELNAKDIELPLETAGKANGSYVTLKCQMISPSP